MTRTNLQTTNNVWVKRWHGDRTMDRCFDYHKERTS